MQQENSFDPARIDWRSLTADQQAALIAQVRRQARRERDRVVGIAIGNAFAWFWHLFRRFRAKPGRSGRLAADCGGR